MARLATAGFERALPGATSVANAEQITYSGSAPSLTTTNARTGSCLASGPTAILDPFGVASGTGVTGRNYYFRAYGRFASAALIELMVVNGPGTFACRVRLQADGTAALFTGGLVQIGSSSAVLATNTWHRFEVRAKINSGSGADDELELRVNGVQVAVTTTATIGTAWPAGSPKITVGGMLIDDLAINDDQGVTQNSWPGDGKVLWLAPISDSAKGTGWTNDQASTTNLFASVDNNPPLGIADTTSGGGTHQIRNATSNANSAYDGLCSSYTAAGVGSTDVVTVVTPVTLTAAPLVTSAKLGTVGVASNPAGTMGNLAAAGTAGAFWQGVAGGTYPTGWKRSEGPIVYYPTVAKGTGPVVRINQVTASTRIAMVCDLGLLVEYVPTDSVQVDQLVNEAGVATDYSVTTLGGTVTEVATRNHEAGGTQSLRINRTGTTRVDATRSSRWGSSFKNSGEFWLWAAALPSANIAIFHVTHGTNDNVEVRLDASGNVTIGRQNSTNSTACTTKVTTGAWFRISWWFDATTTTFDARVAVNDDTAQTYSWTGSVVEAPAEWTFGSRLVTTASTYDLFYDDGTAYVGWYTRVPLASGTTNPITPGGTITPSGAQARSLARTVTGQVTPAGAATKSLARTLTGTVTPAAALAAAHTYPRAFTASVGPVGGQTRSVGKALAGTVTPAGAIVVRSIGKLVAGAVTPAGALSIGKLSAFPTTPVLDDFNRADTGPPPSANWTTNLTNIGHGLQVVGNQLANVSATGDNAEGYWSAASYGPDVDAYLTIANKPVSGTGNRSSSNDLYARVINPGATVSAYGARYRYIDDGTDQATFSVLKYLSGTQTFLVTTARVTALAIGDKFGLRVFGNTIQVWAKRGAAAWTLITSATDPDVTAAGRIGFHSSITLYAGNLLWDDLGAGTYAAVTTTPITPTGTVTPAGVLRLTTSKPLAGAVTPAAALAKSLARTLAGAVTPVGTEARSTGKRLAGTVTPAGAETRSWARTLTGALAPVGALAKSMTRTLAGTITPTGAETRQTGKRLAGTVTPAASMTAAHSFRLSLTAAIAVTGALQKSLARTLTGQIAPTSTLAASRTVFKALAGTVTPASTLVRSLARTLTGAITSSGTQTRQTKLPRGGTVTPTGTERRALTRTLTGLVTPAAAVTVPATHPRSMGGTAAPSGSLSAVRVVGVHPISVGGTIAPTGAEKRTVGKALTGLATPTGAETRSTARRQTGTITPAGAETHSTARRTTGQVTPAGALNAVRVTGVHPISVGGSIAPTGAIVKRALAKTLAGTVAPTASMTATHGAKLSLTAALALTGSETRSVARQLASTLGPTGTLTVASTHPVVASGVIGATGTLLIGVKQPTLPYGHGPRARLSQPLVLTATVAHVAKPTATVQVKHTVSASLPD